MSRILLAEIDCPKSETHSIVARLFANPPVGLVLEHMEQGLYRESFDEPGSGEKMRRPRLTGALPAEYKPRPSRLGPLWRCFCHDVRCDGCLVLDPKWLLMLRDRYVAMGKALRWHPESPEEIERSELLRWRTTTIPLPPELSRRAVAVALSDPPPLRNVREASKSTHIG